MRQVIWSSAVILAIGFTLAGAGKEEADNVVRVTNLVKKTNLNGGSGTVTLITSRDGVMTKTVRDALSGELLNDQDKDKSPVKSKSSRQEDDHDNSHPHSDLLEFFDPDMLDARKLISYFNRCMDELFRRMNTAIKIKKLDPMNLKLLPSHKVKRRTQGLNRAGVQNHVLTTDEPIRSGDSSSSGTTASTLLTGDDFLILSTPTTTTTTTTTAKPTRPPKPARPPTAPSLSGDRPTDLEKEMAKVRGWLYGMSTMKRTGEVSIEVHVDHKIIKCPFSLGPLELKVSKTVGRGKTAKTRSATATTEEMHGIMALNFRKDGTAEIVDVDFDRPGGVEVDGSIKRRKVEDDDDAGNAFKLALAAQARAKLKKVARLVMATPLEATKDSQ